MTAGFSAAFGSRRRWSSGIALVVVLWTLLLLSLIAAGFIAVTRTEVRLARNALDNARAEALADAGVYRGVQELLSPKTKGLFGPRIEDLLELASDPAATRRRMERDIRSQLDQIRNPDLKAFFIDGWRTDGTVYDWHFGDTRISVSIQDEGGKIDLNTAPDELLGGLFLSVGLDGGAAAALVDAIVDFRDEDNLHRLRGAEDRDYADAGLPYGAKDAPFEAIEELRQVLGMTPGVYHRVAPALTVHSGRRGIDPRVAPREALLALQGIASEEVESFVAAREGGNTESLLGAEGYETTSRERVFTIRAEARAESGAVFVREAVVELIGERRKPLPNSNDLFRFLAWKQGSRATAYGNETSEQSRPLSSSTRDYSPP